MVAVVGGTQAGEFIRVGRPVEFAAVHDGAAQSGGVAVHVLGGGVCDDVRAPLKGPAVDGGGEGIVHNERNAVGVGCPGELCNVQHRQGGVGNGLAEHGLGIGAEGGVQLLLGAVRVDKGGFQTHFLHGDGEKVEAAAIDGGAGNNVVTAAGNVEHRHKICRLSGTGEHGGSAALQSADFGGDGVTGGVCQTGIEIALGFQIKKLSHILGGVIFERGTLDDGDLTRFAVFGRITGLNAQCFGTQLGIHEKSPHNVIFRLL